MRLFVCLVLFTVAPSLWAFEPFFDQNPATRYAPGDPQLTDLDLDVLELCGDWGSDVDAYDFERMMLKPEHAAAVSRLQKGLGYRIFSRNEDPVEFVRELRRAWFQQKGFQHVFCGEPGEGADLGGLHYAARYWQAQDRQWAGYRKLLPATNQRPLAKCRKNYLKEKIRPPIYSISLAFDNPKKHKADVKCLSGYNHELNAEDLLLIGTQAFKQANKRVGKNAKEACLFDTRLPGKAQHFSLMVIKQRALRTLYPIADKKPYCKKNKKDYRACLCSRL